MNISAPPRLQSETQERDERFCLEAIVRLYGVVHGRPPDPDGLDAYMGHLRNGTPLEALVTEFVGSSEFRGRLDGQDPRAVLYRNAFGPAQPWEPAQSSEPAQSLGQFAAALVQSPAVQDRLTILPSLYPDGVPLNPRDYRIWLTARPFPKPACRGEEALSLVILIDRPKPDWLGLAVRSVLAASDATNIVVASRWPLRPGIVRAIGRDPRIQLVQAPPWYGRAGLFNRALARCRGTFVGLIGQHDQLDRIPALHSALQQADIVITDDDRLGADGLRHDPQLGTAWDPDRTLAAGCPGLVLIRTALARRIGGMRPAHGREEWALLLAAAAAVDERRIIHVPAIVLSRRDEAAPEPMRPADVAVATRHLRAKGQTGRVHAETGVLRVAYPLPVPPPLASVIIPTKDRADLLRRCMDGLLRRTDYPFLEVVVVDNGSTEAGAVKLLQELACDSRVQLLSRPGPFNWSALNNAGVAAMQGQVAVLLNNDIDVLEPGWLRELVSQAMRPDVGVVGAKLLYENGLVQHAGVVLGPAGRGSHMWRYLPGDTRGYLGQLVVTRRVTAVTGACMAIRREVYQAAGGCDAELPVTWNDVDLCLRIRELGLCAIWTPYARLLHLEQATRGTDDTPENQVRFRREQARMRARWGAAIDHDPFRNPNLLPSETEMRLTPDPGHAVPVPVPVLVPVPASR